MALGGTSATGVARSDEVLHHALQGRERAGHVRFGRAGVTEDQVLIGVIIYDLGALNPGLGLDPQADRQRLRRRYSELVRRYHPDRNGGDRSHEGRLQRVVEAYQLLCKAAAFA